MEEKDQNIKHNEIYTVNRPVKTTKISDSEEADDDDDLFDPSVVDLLENEHEKLPS